MPTGKQWIAPSAINPGVQLIEIQANRGLILTGPGGYVGTMRIWEGITGTPISEEMWHEGAVRAFAFTATGDHILSITENGRVRLSYAGTPSESLRNWMQELGEALSGRTIASDFNVQRLLPEAHATIRQKTGALIRKAARSGDADAQFVLSNSQP